MIQLLAFCNPTVCGKTRTGTTFFFLVLGLLFLLIFVLDIFVHANCLKERLTERVTDLPL